MLNVIDWCIQQRLVHEIHTSERHSFRGCRRRWNWLYTHNYYPKVTQKYFEFGTAFHAALETYYDPETWRYDREVIAAKAILKFADVCEAQKKAFLKIKDEMYLDVDADEDYNERLELGKGMLKYFFNKVVPREDHGWRPIRVEVPFMIIIPNPETGEESIWCKCQRCKTTIRNYAQTHPDFVREEEFLESGLPVVYAGRIDMLIEDSRGHYWIVDWKTAAQIRDDDEYLYLDDQIGSYVWALRRLGLPIQGFIYHIQRKAFPEPPTRNKVIRLGRAFSVNQTQATNYEEYLNTVSTEDKEAYEAGLYDEFLQFLKDEGTVFYRRHQIHKTAYEVDEIEKNIGYEALTMCDPNLRIYPEMGRFSCGGCAFRQPCLGKNAGEDYVYTLNSLFEQREHYYLRDTPSTDSKSGE
jgi:hypothetical protein